MKPKMLKRGFVLIIIFQLLCTIFTCTIVISSVKTSGFLPIADFTYTPKEPIIFNHIKFNDKSTDSQDKIVDWWWDFDDGYYSDVKNPVHFYNTPGSYNVSLIVTNETGYSDTVIKEVVVLDDNIPPIVEIVSLEPWFIEFNFLYFKIRIIGPSLVYGRVYVIVNATDNVGVETVTFYIDDEIKHIDKEPPYIWLWDEQSMLFIYKLKVVAVDYAGNEASDMMQVWRVQVRPPSNK